MLTGFLSGVSFGMTAVGFAFGALIVLAGLAFVGTLVAIACVALYDASARWRSRVRR